jgi:hypothetical protein
MPDLTQPGALPLRPLTTGELLDAAIVLLRTRAGKLIGLGVAAALAEQAVLFPLRRLADVDSSLLPGTGRLGQFGLLVVVEFFTEILVIALLAGTAAIEAPRALLGPRVPRGRARPGAMIVGAVLSAGIGALCAWAFVLLLLPLQVLGLILAILITIPCWVVLYGLFGLVTSAVVVDEVGPFRALGRSLVLSSRGGLRVLWIRVLGYLAWLIIRLSLSFAVVGVVGLFYSSPSNTVDNLLMGATWLLVNSLAYPILGCLDVALLIESRMRTEGLDIGLRVTLRRGRAAELAVAARPAGAR